MMLKRTKNYEHYTMLVKFLNAIFGENGTLRSLGLNDNPVQKAYALAVAETLTHQGVECATLEGHAAIRFLEADTGVGKSLGYLIPMALYAAMTGQRAAVSTFTRTLQRQLLTMWPTVAHIVREHTGKSLTVAIRMGRRNFLCAASVSRALEKVTKSRARAKLEVTECLSTMLEWLVKPTSSGMVFDFLDDHGMQELPSGLRDWALHPADKKAPGFARYAEHVIQSQHADIVVTNHAVTVLNALTRKRLLQFGGSDIPVWMIDEADRLRTSAESLVQDGVSLHRLNTLLQVLRLAAPSIITEPVIADTTALFNTLVAHRKPESKLLRDMPQEVTECLAGAHESLAPLSSALIQWLDQLDPMVIDLDLRDQALELIENLESFNEFVESLRSSAQDEPHLKITLVAWSDKKHWPSLICGSTNPGYVMNRYFRAVNEDECSPQAVMFTSATLRSFSSSSRDLRSGRQADMQDIEKELGVFNRTPGVIPAPPSFSPRSFGVLEAIVLADRRVPSPYAGVELDEDEHEIEPNAEWVNYARLMIQRAADTRLGADSPGRTLVLCASFADTARFGRLLARSHGARVVTHRKGESLNACVKRFLALSDAILLTPSAWEGLDLPNAISHIVVPRLPFETPKSTSKIIEEAFLKSRYEHYESIKAIRRRNRVLAKLKQGFGRGIRSEQDSMHFWIADPRVTYPEEIINDFTQPKVRAIHASARKTRSPLSIAPMFPHRFANMLNKAFVLSLDNELLGCGWQLQGSATE